MPSDADHARFLPHVGHWTPGIAVHDDGAMSATFHLAGMAAELAGARAVAAAHLRDNQMARNVSDPRIELWDHFVRQDRQDMATLPVIPNWFAARFDAAYRDAQGAGSLYRNDLFLTVVMRPADTIRSGFGALLGRSRSRASCDGRAVEDFETVLGKMDAGLARYGARRLALRETDGVVFSEIAEAMHLVMTGRFRPLGLTMGRLGHLILPERAIFGQREMQIAGEGQPLFAALLSFKDYPARTSPVMFTALRQVPFPITLTNSTWFRQKAHALGTIDRRVKQMQSGNDAARSQIEELQQDEDDVMSGRSVYVLHGFSAAVRAASLADLDARVSQVQNVLSDAGVTAIRETDALKPAFYAQLPGNARWRPRPGLAKSINATAMAARHNVPRGTYKGRWGAPVIMFRTTSDTEYAFHFQVQASATTPAEDQGNALLIGPGGSGKTSLLGSVCLLALRNPATRVVVVDKDFGLSIAIRAAGGSYLVLPSGKPSGLAPLRGLHGTPEDAAFLKAFVRGLILSDGQGDLDSNEDERLGRAIALQLSMPAGIRGIAGISVMLGQRGKDGAGTRLRRWCRGESLGWAFDGEQDELDMTRRIMGFDTTAILRDETVCSPTLSYLFYRTRKLIDGNPLVLAVDEFWQTDRVAAFREENNDHLKTIRKNEGIVLLATQSAHDALSSAVAHTIKQQTPTKIFFGDETASHADLVDGMGLTEAEYLAVTQQLPNLRHAFLIKRHGGSVLCRFDLSGMRDKIAVISGRRSLYDLSNRLIARHGADPQAWVPHFEAQAPGLSDDPSTIIMQEAAE